MPLAFIGGVHGAGKGVLAAGLSRKLDMVHWSAGGLIQQHRGSVESGKEVEDVKGNQDALLSALEARSFRHVTVLLDGHFAVLGPSGEPEPLPLAVFRGIEPLGLILLAADPEETHSRLLHRDGRAPAVAQLAALQEAEIENGCAVAKELGTPLLLLGSPRVDLAAAFLTHTLGR